MTDAHKAQRDKIEKLDGAWGDAATSYNLDDVLSFYSKDATLVWPGQPPVHGADAVRAAWESMFKGYTGLKLTFTPTRITIAESDDLAVDFGVVDFSYEDKGVVTSIAAKYVVAWRREGGTWKVLYDSWNENTAS